MLAPCLNNNALGKNKWDNICKKIEIIILKEIIGNFCNIRSLDNFVKLRVNEELKKIELNDLEKLQFVLIEESIVQFILNVMNSSLTFRIKFKDQRFVYLSDFNECDEEKDFPKELNEYVTAQHLCFNLSKRYYQEYLPIPKLEIVFFSNLTNELFSIDFDLNCYINKRYSHREYIRSLKYESCDILW